MRQDNQFGLTFLMTNGLVSRYTRYNTQENFQQISSNTLDCYILISHEISKKTKAITVYALQLNSTTTNDRITQEISHRTSISKARNNNTQ